MRTHTGETSYSCQQCQKAFAQAYNLKIHIRTHTGEKPLSCSQCPKAFSHPLSLKIHIRSHTGETSFPCNQCSKEFNQRSNLRRQLVLVHLSILCERYYITIMAHIRYDASMTLAGWGKGDQKGVKDVDISGPVTASEKGGARRKKCVCVSRHLEM